MAEEKNNIIEPHVAAHAKCGACGYEWVAERPLKMHHINLECPRCEAMTGLDEGPHWPTPEGESAEQRLRKIQKVVNEQAEDEGLWFYPESAPEAHLQRALRRLHAVIEGEEETCEPSGSSN